MTRSFPPVLLWIWSHGWDHRSLSTTCCPLVLSVFGVNIVVLCWTRESMGSYKSFENRWCQRVHKNESIHRSFFLNFLRSRTIILFWYIFLPEFIERTFKINGTWSLFWIYIILNKRLFRESWKRARPDTLQMVACGLEYCYLYQLNSYFVIKFVLMDRTMTTYHLRLIFNLWKWKRKMYIEYFSYLMYYETLKRPSFVRKYSDSRLLGIRWKELITRSTSEKDS